MQIGSIVVTTGDFEKVRFEWGLPYPKKGDVLTVCSITKHPNSHCNKKGIVLLKFDEIPSLVGVCDKTINGDPNFIELPLPDDIEELLKIPEKYTINTVILQQISEHEG